MKIISGSTIDAVYRELLMNLLNYDSKFTASRLGPAKDMGPCLIELNGRAPHLLRVKQRALNPFLVVMEACWIFSGHDDLKPMELAVRNFKHFSDDGVHLYGAYGKRLRDANGLDQIITAIDLLRSDSSTRRVFLPIYFARDLGAPSRDIPCNLGMMLICRDGRLEATVINRSNDAVLGVPYDIFSFSFLHWFIARQVGLPKGTYRHFSNCMHLYEKDVAVAEAVASQTGAACSWNEEQIMKLATEMVHDARAIASVELDNITSPRLRRLFFGLASWRASGEMADFENIRNDEIFGEMIASWMGARKTGLANT
jgi:hypothetical protein